MLLFDCTRLENPIASFNIYTKESIVIEISRKALFNLHFVDLLQYNFPAKEGGEGNEGNRRDRSVTLGVVIKITFLIKV